MTDHRAQAEDAIREAIYDLNHTDDPTVEDKLDVIACALIGISHAFLALGAPGDMKPAAEHDPRCAAARNYQAPCTCP